MVKKRIPCPLCESWDYRLVDCDTNTRSRWKNRLIFQCFNCGTTFTRDGIYEEGRKPFDVDEFLYDSEWQ